MAGSSEQRELSLVGKVELRIALVETDSKLETTLKTYLPPLLLKLASEHLSVRNKVSCSSISIDKSARVCHPQAGPWSRVLQGTCHVLECR